MPAAKLIDERTIKKYDRGQFRTVSDALVVEVSIKLILNGSGELAVLACSPEAFEELTAGYLLSEGIIADYDDLVGIRVEGENIFIELKNRDKFVPNRGYISSCSGKRLPGDYSRPDLNQAGFERFSAGDLLSLIGQLDEKSTTFRCTGGIHSAALGCGSNLLFRYEDIGRHNAVDKVLGHTFIDRVPPADKCLVLSGRIAWEIVWKAAKSHIPLILSRSAPTQKAVEWAECLGITIVGFARGERFNIYSHWDRVEA